MAIDSHYIPAFSIEDVILDKDTGAPLSGGQVYFEQDNQRGVLKPVYQITGTSPNYSYTQLPNPMTLSSIGTFEDSLGNPVIPYFFPYDSNFDPELYYIRVESSEGVPQFAREAQPYIASGGDTSISSAFVNELSNPQFAEVLFTSPKVYTFNAVTDEAVEIAPGWEIVVSCSGVGTVTLSQLTPIGSLNRVTNPGTILNLNSTGLSSFRLRQRIFGSPNLWGSGYLSGTFIAKTYAGTSSTVSLLYSQSNGSVVDQTIVTGILSADGLYQAYPGSFLIPASTSTQSFPDAYIDIELDIPLSTQIDISSVMVTATGQVSVDNIVYDQTTYARQIDELFHYYKPQIDYKPIPSFLVGWDFPLNPALCNGYTVNATVNANAYTWDQTIIYQSVVSSLNTTRAANGAMVVTSVDATNSVQAALIQYLPQSVVRNMLEDKLSVNIEGDSPQTGGLKGTVSLWYSTNANVPTLPASLITTLDANGHPSAVVAGWIEIPRSNQVGNAEFTLIATLEDYGFNGWDLSGTTASNTATWFAIVVGTEAMDNGSTFSFNSISVVPGDIPTVPAPQTQDQVIRECQYYYEKSYPQNEKPGTASSNGVVSAEMLTVHPLTDDQLISRQFGIRFNTQKWTTSSIPFLYAIDGTVNEVTGYQYSSGTQVNSGSIAVAGNWSGNVGRTGTYYTPANVTPLLTHTVGSTTTAEAFILFHYTIDARPGISGVAP